MSDAYEIRIRGHLAPRWGSWFDGLTLTLDPDGTTVIRADVADLLDEAVQGRLVGDPTADDRGAVGVLRERVSLEPRGPPWLEVSTDPDLVGVAHVPEGRSGRDERGSPDVVNPGVNPRLRNGGRAGRARRRAVRPPAGW